MNNYFKYDYHAVGYERMSEQDVVNEVRKLLHVFTARSSKKTGCWHV
jgi:hypothetical protein